MARPASLLAEANPQEVEQRRRAHVRKRKAISTVNTPALASSRMVAEAEEVMAEAVEGSLEVLGREPAWAPVTAEEEEARVYAGWASDGGDGGGASGGNDGGGR